MSTDHLSLPLLAASQSQKHVTHNEALIALDALVHLAVIDLRNTPPEAPAAGDRHLVGSSPGSAFAGQAGQIAAFQDGAWAFFTPRAGWIAWLASENTALVHDGTAWIDLKPRSADTLSINASADATNRLAVASPAALFNHAGAGSQVKVNKAAAGDTASVLFQTGFSGRAEFGLAGDDDWHVKVSPDGAAWHEAVVVDRNTGLARFPQGLVHPASGLPLAQLLPCTVVPEIWRLDAARPGTPRTYTIASISGTALNLTAGADTIFGVSMAGASMVRVWNTSKTPAQPAWVVGVSGTTQLAVSQAADISGWSSGETVRLGDPNPTGSNALQMVAVDISPYMQANFGAAFPQKGVLFATYCSAAGASSSLDGSGTGVTGSATGTAALSDGSRSYSAMTLFTPELSPVSSANLVFLRETLGAASALGTCYLRLQGVYV